LLPFDSSKMWEGYGGPIRLDDYHLDGIDPALDDCCRREVEYNRVHNALTSTLSRHDVTRLAERRRRNVLQNLNFGSGCRCCYDPNIDGGEYRALTEMKEKLKREGNEISDVADEEVKTRRDSGEGFEDEDDEFDYLLDEDLPVESSVEKIRRAELEFAMLSQETAIQHGYGVHRQMHPSRVLKAAGLGGGRDAPHGVVLHLFDPESLVSASLDVCLEMLAAKYKGTKFLRSLGRSTLVYGADFASKHLSDIRPDSDMPILVAIREGCVVATSLRLRGMANDDEVVTHAVEDWLEHAHVLVERPPPFEEVCHIRPEEEALLDHMVGAKVQQSERYDCGIPTCYKAFPHDHIGVQTAKQDGLLVQQETVIGAEDASDVRT
jgi:hypothetical protein